jgi:hypothetical protein
MTVQITKINTGIHRGWNFAFSAQAKQFFHKPEIRVLGTKGNMGPGNGDHAFSPKNPPQTRLDPHGIGNGFPLVTI